jgi:FAS-associated factor 2
MEKLVQLQDLTSIEDLEICLALLESKNWDLEATAREQLGIPGEEQEGPQIEEPEQLHNVEQPPSPPPIPRPIPNHVHPHAVWRRPRGLTSWALYLLTLPLRLVYTSLTGVYDFVTSLLGFPPRRSSAVTDPLGDVNSFYSEFEQQYGTSHPPFYRGTYSQVLEEAKRELKFLLVYLHSESHQDTEVFCRDTRAG